MKKYILTLINIFVVMSLVSCSNQAPTSQEKPVESGSLGKTTALTSLTATLPAPSSLGGAGVSRRVLLSYDNNLNAQSIGQIDFSNVSYPDVVQHNDDKYFDPD